MSKNFLGLGNDAFNLAYVKSIECDKYSCRVTIANTKQVALAGDDYDEIFCRDTKISFTNGSKEYEKLQDFVKSLNQ